MSGLGAGPYTVTFVGDLAGHNLDELEAVLLTPDVAAATTTQGGATSEVQRAGFSDSMSLMGGTFTLSFGGYTTGAISYNASAGTVETALAALTSIGSGNIGVTKTQNTFTAQEWTLTFQGSLAGADQAQVTINSGSVMHSGTLTDIQATDTTGSTANEVQTVTLENAQTGSGHFTLTFDGQRTDPIAFGATDSTVETALLALSNIGSGDVAVSGSAGGPYTVSFLDDLAAENVPQLVPAIVVRAVTVATTTAGGDVNEIQRVGMSDTMSIFSGTFTLSFGGHTTSGISYNASAGTVQTALEGLTSVGSGNVAVTKTQNTFTAQEWTLTFQGSLAGADQAQVTINTASVSHMGTLTDTEATDTNGFSASEVQTVTPEYLDSGDFTLTFDDQTTGPIAFDADNETVELALANLSSIGEGNVTVTGSAGGPYTVTFQGDLANEDVPEISGEAGPAIVVLRSLAYDWDDAGQLLSASDPSATYTFVPDNLGRVTSITAELAGFSSDIVMAQSFDVNNNRTQLATSIGATADFVNDYVFDNLQRQIRIDRHGVGGGNTVAETRIDLAYNAAGQFDTIDRFADLAGEDLVLTTAFGYDLIGRLSTLDHGQGVTALAGYAFTYDVSSRIEEIDSLIDGLTTYSYDTTNQLVAADFATQDDETHVWDPNGNPDEEGMVIGLNNQVLSDGTYNYLYDGEGNRIRRTKISDGTYTDYEWDHRNRLTDVLDYDAEDNLLQHVHYGYDYLNRWIFREIDPDGDGEDPSTAQWFALDGNQVVLSFGDSEATAPDHRYLNGPVVDQYFTDENDENDVLQLLGDHLGTIRDTALFNSGTGDTELKNHTTYGTFHTRLSDTDAAFASLIGETGRPHDAATGLDNHLHRWLEGWLKQWLGQDPIGFASKETNLSRLVHNNPVSFADPTGLIEEAAPQWANGGIVTLTNLRVQNLKLWSEMFAEDHPGVANDKWYEYLVDFRNNMPYTYLAARSYASFTLSGTAVLKDSITCGKDKVDVDIRINFSFKIVAAYSKRGTTALNLAASSQNPYLGMAVFSYQTFLKPVLEGLEFIRKASSALISNAELARYSTTEDGKLKVSSALIWRAFRRSLIGNQLTLRETVSAGPFEVGMGGRPSSRPHLYWWQPEDGSLGDGMWSVGDITLPFGVSIIPSGR